MKSKCCNKPLRLSRENPQRGETVYYICEGCNQPADPRPAGDVAQVHLDQKQLHADDYVDSNYPIEKEVLTFDQKLRIGAIKCKNNVCENDPTCGLPDHLFCKCENGTPCFDTCFEFKKYVDEKVREERADERKKVLSKVERWLRENIRVYNSEGIIDERELYKKLNQLKEEEK